MDMSQSASVALPVVCVMFCSCAFLTLPLSATCSLLPALFCHFVCSLLIVSSFSLHICFSSYPFSYCDMLYLVFSSCVFVSGHSLLHVLFCNMFFCSFLPCEFSNHLAVIVFTCSLYFCPITCRSCLVLPVFKFNVCIGSLSHPCRTLLYMCYSDLLCFILHVPACLCHFELNQLSQPHCQHLGPFLSITPPPVTG